MLLILHATKKIFKLKGIVRQEEIDSIVNIKQRFPNCGSRLYFWLVTLYFWIIHTSLWCSKFKFSFIVICQSDNIKSLQRPCQNDATSLMVIEKITIYLKIINRYLHIHDVQNIWLFSVTYGTSNTIHVSSCIFNTYFFSNKFEFFLYFYTNMDKWLNKKSMTQSQK